MKYAFVIALSLASSFSFANDCKQNEAQIFADVVEVDDLPRPDTPSCETKIKLTQVQDHVLCPIGRSEGSELIITVFKSEKPLTCYQAGDQVSGVLVEDSKGNLSLE